VSKTRGRARYEEATSGRRNAVMWAIAHAPRSSSPGGLTNTERCALFVVETFVGFDDRNTGWCSPSVSTLAEALDLSARRTQETLRALKEKGWLAIEAHFVEGYQACNRYRVTPPAAPDASPPGSTPAPVH